MFPTTYGTSGLFFGLTAETGIIIDTLSRTPQASKKEAKDNYGNIVGVAYYGPKTVYEISGYSLTSGLTTASIGSSVTLANASSSNGISGGNFLVDSLKFDYSNEDFEKINATVTQYPSV